MSQDFLKLTAYFDERQRSGGRFLSAQMLDLFGRRSIAASVALRGVGGFGARRHLRSDRSLSLSEDPPVVVAAVDAKPAIEALLDPLRAMPKRALVTLERARLLEDSDAVEGTTKLTVYLGRKERINRFPGYIAVCDLLYRNGFDGASAFLGVDGTIHGRRERAHFFGGNADVPVMIIAVGRAECVNAVLPELRRMLRRPLITVERVTVCKRDGQLLEHPDAVAGVDEHGMKLWQKLMVYTGEPDLHGGVPIHRALVHRLWEHRSLGGATVLRAIWGYQGGRAPRGDRLLQVTRRVPVATIIVDTPRNIAECFEAVDELTDTHGLVTSETVPALAATDGCGYSPDWG
ncbi:DUF190 domain-containing protein [Mycolicibacter sp. MYC123]|uniref:DUF190 domain-containing protein n=1 Tax=[Mycobacterium] zoologicum TaxID=2872311 RepID=A0ABU5YHV1_9MYCO|nr:MULTISPECIES: DUF190 domain-containing protein [unclassified Mycolicibacter]MEB3049632.1 DUF190 domain-containing protein [Mycolicibacter sp. MYC123]MEB3063492.1 DUF190 domain-containing protein [Mycolicibacter sp. MYC101]